jgi:hypothetical protein
MKKKDVAMYTMIPCIDASDMPDKVIDWCEEHEISTHYSDSMARLTDDGNAMAEWLKEIGVPKEIKKWVKYKKPVNGKEGFYTPWYDWNVAIIAT